MSDSNHSLMSHTNYARCPSLNAAKVIFSFKSMPQASAIRISKYSKVNLRQTCR